VGETGIEEEEDEEEEEEGENIIHNGTSSWIEPCVPERRFLLLGRFYTSLGSNNVHEARLSLLSNV
jgi:hypothetical protein